MKAITTVMISVLPLGISCVLQAQTRPAGPPQEALSACEAKAASAQCQMTTPRGQLSGQCRNTPRGDLACMPEGHQPRARGGGRPERGERAERPARADRPARAERGQGGARRGPRSHTITQSAGQAKRVPATQAPITQSRIRIDLQSGYRIIQANGVSHHKTGAFPNRGNPHTIREQMHQFRVPLNPVLANKITASRMGDFGIAVNGVTFDPGAGEVFATARDWHYEALSGAIPLGLDTSNAHVQPSGKYHYHGLPTGLMQRLGVSAGKHSPLIGWAADGFPIYALYGYTNGKNASGGIRQEVSSYRVKSGPRPGGSLPSGHYDGTFVKDYEYIAGSGTLDECNGRITVTPEYPQGTYAYFLTGAFPVVPRCYKGTPSPDFARNIPLLGRSSF